MLSTVEYLRKGIVWIEVTIGRSAFYLQSLKFLRDLCTIRLIITWIQNYQLINAGFEKSNLKNCLLFMVEKLRQCLNNKGSTGILLTDLSKAFDCLVHDLLIAKLHAYGFEYNAIKLICSYFNRRYQRVRINSTYSS